MEKALIPMELWILDTKSQYSPEQLKEEYNKSVELLKEKFNFAKNKLKDKDHWILKAISSAENGLDYIQTCIDKKKIDVSYPLTVLKVMEEEMHTRYLKIIFQNLFTVPKEDWVTSDILPVMKLSWFSIFNFSKYALNNPEKASSEFQKLVEDFKNDKVDFEINFNQSQRTLFKNKIAKAISEMIKKDVMNIFDNINCPFSHALRFFEGVVNDGSELKSMMPRKYPYAKWAEDIKHATLDTISVMLSKEIQ